jgi:hypothetical protein
LDLEPLEQRCLLSSTPAAATTGLLVDTTSYSQTDILVQFRGSKPVALAGTTVGPSLPLVANLYQINLTSAVSPTQAVKEYSADSLVVTASLDYNLAVGGTTSTTTSTQYDMGSSAAGIDAVAAQTVTTGSASVIVAVMDTGIDYIRISTRASGSIKPRFRRAGSRTSWIITTTATSRGATSTTRATRVRARSPTSTTTGASTPPTSSPR